VPILMGTLGKALGSHGAFVAGSDTLIEHLIQSARSYIYSTAMPPAVAAATRASLKLVINESWRREQLNTHIQYFKRACLEIGVELMPSDTAIQPINVGSDSRALQLSEFLFEHGFWVSAIRPPTVPEGSARLRLTLSAMHDRKHIDTLISVLSDGLKKLDTQAPSLQRDTNFE